MYCILMYILLIFVIILLMIGVYIKIKFRFWSIQPVFHIYDLHYYFCRPHIIDSELPAKNKYCNFDDIETIKYESLSPIKINLFSKFIKRHFLQNNGNTFNPKKRNILPYFEGHNSQSYFTYYFEPEILIERKGGDTIKDKRVIGVITSRPLHISLNNSSTRPSKFDVYYVDYLCVDKTKRKSGIAPQLIQTHEYRQRHGNQNIKISLFKREGELTGIIPLCLYSTYVFDMDRWTKPPSFDASIKLVECGRTNIHHLLDFLKDKSESKFDICIMSELSNILELIKTKNIFVWMLIINNIVESVYFFKKSCTCIKDDKEALILFASINNLEKKHSDIFIHAYKIVLFNICESFPVFKYAVLEEVSDNDIIISDLVLRSRPEFISPTAYFFYNYVSHTFQPKRVFIIC
jgi:hypothetical protein